MDLQLQFEFYVFISEHLLIFRMSQVVKIIAALGVFFGYPIQFFVMMKIIWPPVKRGYSCAQKYPITMQVMLRFIMIMLTCKCNKFFLNFNKNCNDLFHLQLVLLWSFLNWVYLSHLSVHFAPHHWHLLYQFSLISWYAPRSPRALAPLSIWRISLYW